MNKRNSEFGIRNSEFGMKDNERQIKTKSKMEPEMKEKFQPRDLRIRTKEFALRVIRLVNSLEYGKSTDVIGKQLLRSGTSVGANYRAACRGRSTAEFIAKMGIVEEEADESVYWMELLVEEIGRASCRERVLASV